MLDPGRSAPMDRVSPSSLHALETCRLQVALGRQSTGVANVWNGRAVLGDACHHVLERLVTRGEIYASNWEGALGEAWEEELRTMAAQAAIHRVVDAPMRWPGAELTRARLTVVARRVRELLSGAGSDAEVLTEPTLRSRDGLLEGRLDLLVRGSSRHAVIDYKTGATVDPTSGTMREAYLTQLQLYSYLEWECSGSWPSEALLLPFNGPPLHIDVDPIACASRAQEARALLAAYNATAPGAQPASPTPQGCAYCPFSVECDAFWETVTPSWASEILAAEGAVIGVHESQLGTVNVQILAERGSVARGDCLVRGIRPGEHAVANRIAPGDTARATRLHLEADRGSYALPVWGGLMIVDESSRPSVEQTSWAQ
jgi:PD-(D/E)XK nuclease superfamily